MIVSRTWAGKRYAVLGLARSGVATVAALLASGAEVVAWDSNEAKRGGDGTFADPLTLDLTGFTAVVVSPGVPLNTHPIAAHAAKFGVPVIGDIELFAQARSQLPPHRVIGITGTNGKSTTTALVHHILQTAGVPTTMGGNIGLPILGQEPLPAGGVYVLELSSFQIDLTFTLDCDVAVLLNVTPDHLERYDGFEAYRKAKLRLFAMSSGRHFVGNDRGLPKASIPAHWPALQGPHNLQNAQTAANAVRAVGMSDVQIEAGLCTYPGLPHRMERVRERDGVLFVNDSKATNATSAAPALAAYPAVRWILGGRAKTDDLDACAPYFGHVRSAYTIGEAGPMFAALLRPYMPVAECATIENAVLQAAAEARPGDTVLLSPACASFDQFRDFEDRGNAFRQLVEAL